MEVKMRYIFLLCSLISFYQSIFCSEGDWQVAKPTVNFEVFLENSPVLNCGSMQLTKSNNKVTLKIKTQENNALLLNLGVNTLAQLRQTTQQLYTGKSFETGKKLLVTVNKNGHYKGELCV